MCGSMFSQASLFYYSSASGRVSLKLSVHYLLWILFYLFIFYFILLIFYFLFYFIDFFGAVKV